MTGTILAEAPPWKTRLIKKGVLPPPCAKVRVMFGHSVAMPLKIHRLYVYIWEFDASLPVYDGNLSYTLANAWNGGRRAHSCESHPRRDIRLSDLLCRAM